MNIKFLNYEKSLMSFKHYKDSLKKIQSLSLKYKDEIDKIKEEAASIIKSSSSLILDESIKMRNAERYKSLEERAYQLEFNYKNEASQLQNSEMTKINELLEEIVTNYSKDNSIDMVINSNHVIYSKSELDITEDIINYFKDNDLFVEIEDFETEMS